MFDLSKLKIKKRSLSTLKPATDEQIAELENYCGHNLPESYKEILINYNGGLPTACYFDSLDEDSGIPLQYQLARFLILDVNKNLPATIWWHIKNYSHVMGPNAIPFADDGLHQIYYLKWVNNIPQVWYLTYLDLDEPEIFMVSESFDKLLGDLYAEN